MAKTKQQKTKPKKGPHVKNQGKQADTTQFCAQLDALGLKIVRVTADGNCFFRAIADQLEGNEEEHGKYRRMVVQYIMKNHEMFGPFIEDDIPFDDYCQSMEKDGTWAGHMELQAASLVTRSNICIHRCMSPRWYVRNFDQRGARMVHLSYHDEEHYNSLRLKEDPCDGPAKPIIIKADADLSVTSRHASSVTSKNKGGATTKNVIDMGSIKLVMAGSGCQTAEKVEQVLQQVDGDVDAAIEYLIAEQETDDCLAENDSPASEAVPSHECQGDDKNGTCDQEEEPVKGTNKCHPSDGGIKRTHGDSSSQANDKNIPKNKVCSCGSKKKFKNCCGAAKGRSSIKFVVNQTVDSRKGRKDRKQGKKVGPAESVLSRGSDGGPPDMGALCI